jgi:hypothetical protein
VVDEAPRRSGRLPLVFRTRVAEVGPIMTAKGAESKRLYNLAERDAYGAWVAAHGPVKGGQKGFRRILKANGMKVPHHYTRRPKTPETIEAERKFVEEGLGRSGRYDRHRYPEASDDTAA